MSRTSTYLAALTGVICGLFLLDLIFFAHARTVRKDVVQGILIGAGLAFVTAQIYARIKATQVNGWITMFGLGDPGNGLLLRAAHAQLFPGPVNVPHEAMYWWTNVDGAGRPLSGARAYRLHFPPGGLPPNQEALRFRGPGGLRRTARAVQAVASPASCSPCSTVWRRAVRPVPGHPILSLPRLRQPTLMPSPRKRRVSEYEFADGILNVRAPT
ncbi:MAG: hypothetical protein M3Z04_11055 [Chloroflexota bacterium]|nr:hypothetical protein [Chloroflexota bacterium]